MRKKIVAGNWKLNKTFSEGLALAKEVCELSKNELNSDVQLVLCTPFIHLQQISSLVSDYKNLSVAAQNCYTQKSGSFTGETSAEMIASIGVQYVIIGHSERREYFNEGNQMLAEKVNITLSNGLTPIFCCGEALAVREAETQNEFVEVQLKESLFHLSESEIKKITIAYEPIWAIGTGKTASAEQAQDMHAYIRNILATQYGKDVADSISILYGGSVKGSNAKEIFGKQDVDGGLVGGASLKAGEFVQVISGLK